MGREPAIGPRSEERLVEVLWIPSCRVWEEGGGIAELETGREEWPGSIPIVATARGIGIADGCCWRTETVTLSTNAHHPFVKLARDCERDRRAVDDLMQR